MSAGPLLDELRVVIQISLGTLEALTTTMCERAGRMKPGERRYARTVVDRLARRIVTWEEIVRDEPELLRSLKALAERVRELQSTLAPHGAPRRIRSARGARSGPSPRARAHSGHAVSTPVGSCMNETVNGVGLCSSGGALPWMPSLTWSAR